MPRGLVGSTTTLCPVTTNQHSDESWRASRVAVRFRQAYFSRVCRITSSAILIPAFCTTLLLVAILHVGQVGGRPVAPHRATQICRHSTQKLCEPQPAVAGPPRVSAPMMDVQMEQKKGSSESASA